MTRKEQRTAKLIKEQLFLKSIEGKVLNQVEKAKFRETSVWKDFRKKFAGSKDPITLKPLPKRYNLHHLCLNPSEYQVLKMDRFIPLNSTTHDIVHYLYKYYRKDKNILRRLKAVLDKMVEVNDGKDVCDYKKVKK